VQGGKVVGTNKDGLIEARIEGNTVAPLVSAVIVKQSADDGC
jgi:hypothetical protein